MLTVLTPIRDVNCIKIPYSQWKIKSKDLFKMVSSFLGKCVIPNELSSLVSEISETTDMPNCPHREGQQGRLLHRGVYVTRASWRRK